MTDAARRALLYHFCRMQMPAVAVAPDAFGRHLDRTFAVYRAKVAGADFAAYLDTLYCLDWYLCCACLAAREALGRLSDGELLILGLRLRYRMSQREVAHLLGVHEGTISRQTDKLRDRCLEQISRRLLAQGWTGDDLTEFILTEMGPLLLDEPRLAADRLAG